MALKKLTETLGAHEYTVTQLPAIAGREALRRFLKVGASGLDAVQALTTDNPEEAFMALAKGVLGIINNLSETDLAYFCDVFGPTTTVRLPDGKEPRIKDVFSDHFAGNYVEMVLWLAFCVRANFQDFFSAGIARLKSALPAAPASSDKEAVASA